tara:strand:- start:56 stop:313 length:258 start_codon:yes stop_codon:yes gene_type:complete
MQTNEREIYIQIDLKSLTKRKHKLQATKRKHKLQALETLIKNIELCNGDLYTMRKGTKELFINNLFQLDLLTIQLLNVHLEKISL